MGNPGTGKVTSDRHGLADRAVSCLRRRDVAIKTMVLAILLIGPYTQQSAPPARGAMYKDGNEDLRLGKRGRGA
ncbi:hypothetical protein HRbin10_01006 [bacterium HR10]|nr:hypothetical protein HRbin10_01006 [bacterium HR10]